MKNVELTVVLGRYALAYHLPDAGKTVTEVVLAVQKHWPHVVPLPHPSPRNRAWLKRNPWFGSELIPKLRRRVRKLLCD